VVPLVQMAERGFHFLAGCSFLGAPEAVARTVLAEPVATVLSAVAVEGAVAAQPEVLAVLAVTASQ
jgi:hypothetical protein